MIFEPQTSVYLMGEEKKPPPFTENYGASSISPLVLLCNIRKFWIKSVQVSDELLSSPGLGSAPHIFMVGPEDEGIRLTCTGKGWFPQPEVQWKDAKGEKLPSLSEDETQDDDGLFQIEASLIVRDSSKREVFCSMKNPFFGQEQEATISIPGQCCSFWGQEKRKEGIFGTWDGIDLPDVCF